LNARTALLGLFVLLTVILASTTVYESGSSATVTSTSTLTRTSTVTQTSAFPTVATITTVTTVINELTPFANPLFMVPPANGGAEISFGADTNDAVQFDCGPAIGAPGVTCGVQFNNGGTANTNTSIIMTYPQIGQPNEPAWANCIFEGSSYILESGIPSGVVETSVSVYLGQEFGYCVQVAVGTYVIAEPTGYAQPPA